MTFEAKELCKDNRIGLILDGNIYIRTVNPIQLRIIKHIFDLDKESKNNE